MTGQVWWYMPVITALGRWRHDRESFEDRAMFKEQDNYVTRYIFT
jgi:hypothetical protein